MAKDVAADHPDSIRLEILSPDSDQANGLDTRKSISMYINRQRIPIKTGLSKPDLEECIHAFLEGQEKDSRSP